MSQYLIIKKDGTTIGEWSRLTKLYQASHRTSYNEESFNPEKEFPLIIENLKEKIEEYKDSKDTYERMLSGLNSYEERFDTITSIKELEDEITECESAMHDVYFMKNCWECSQYSEDEENVWIWCKN